jgi:prepilin-type processing-associated H-X9-DG protein
MSEILLFADGIQVSTTSGSCQSALVEVDVCKALPAVANANNPIDRSPDVDSVVGGAAVTGGHLRYRHGGGKANVVFADGHVAGYAQQGLKQRNFAINY